MEKTVAITQAAGWVACFQLEDGQGNVDRDKPAGHVHVPVAVWVLGEDSGGAPFVHGHVGPDCLLSAEDEPSFRGYARENKRCPSCNQVVETDH